jgi:hypothetical protein
MSGWGDARIGQVRTARARRRSKSSESYVFISGFLYVTNRFPLVLCERHLRCIESHNPPCTLYVKAVMALAVALYLSHSITTASLFWIKAIPLTLTHTGVGINDLEPGSFPTSPPLMMALPLT